MGRQVENGQTSRQMGRQAEGAMDGRWTGGKQMGKRTDRKMNRIMESQTKLKID